MRVCGRPRSRRAAQARCRGIADVPDAPVTAASGWQPDRTRTRHSHGAPSQAA